MQTVDDEPMETLHIYFEQEQPPRPSLLPVFLAVVALSILIAIGILTPNQQPEQRASIRVPAVLLPPRMFTASSQIIPTGVKIYPATYAHGFLTFSNGSVIGQSVPQGFTISGAMTDSSVYVPPATANGFGMSTVSAHLLTSGINLSTLSINEVVGSSLFIRNLSPFTGGHPAYSVTFVTAQDKQTALTAARNLLAVQRDQIQAFLAKPCSENHFPADRKMVVSWRCQFATYQVLSYMHVLGAKLTGRDFLVTVEFIPRSRRFWAK